MNDVRADLARMPRYRCHKIVSALQIQEVQLLEISHVARLIFSKSGFERLKAKEA